MGWSLCRREGLGNVKCLRTLYRAASCPTFGFAVQRFNHGVSNLWTFVFLEISGWRAEVAFVLWRSGDWKRAVVGCGRGAELLCFSGRQSSNWLGSGHVGASQQKGPDFLPFELCDATGCQLVSVWPWHALSVLTRESRCSYRNFVVLLRTITNAIIMSFM